MSADMMDPSEWLMEARACEVGTKNKVKHLCGDASLVVYNNVDSWSAWCWRCHTRGWVPKDQPSMKERLARKEQQRRIDSELSYQTRAPFPASFDTGTWTPAARLWLYKAGLNAGLIRRLGAYFHGPTGRVVLPLRDSDGKVVFWQARNPEYPKDGGPKYISSSVPRDRVHAIYRGIAGEYTEVYGRGAGRESTGTGAFVLTEDILSAFKVGMSGGGYGYAVMGTSLGQHTISLLLREAVREVYLWFDPDAAGEDARRTISKQLRFVGIDPIAINTDRDPKCYSLGEIRSIIDEFRSHAVADNARAQEVLPVTADAEP